MQKMLVCSLFLAMNCLLLGADDPFAGTWKYNVAKSKPGPAQPGMAMKEQTMTVEESNGQATVTFKGTRENGSPASMKYTTPLNGGAVNYSEGGPPAGVSVTTKRINDRAVDFITTNNGKVVSTNHVTVSANGKTMQLNAEGVNAQGQPVQSMIVYQKQ